MMLSSILLLLGVANKSVSFQDTAGRDMVFYYTPRDSSYTVYVGRDKYENEELLKHGWDLDVWFHVDKVGLVPT